MRHSFSYVSVLSHASDAVRH